MLVKQTTPDETVEVDTEYLRNTYATRTGYKVRNCRAPPTESQVEVTEPASITWNNAFLSSSSGVVEGCLLGVE